MAIYTEPEITVGHRTISDHFWHMSDQKSIILLDNLHMYCVKITYV